MLKSPCSVYQTIAIIALDLLFILQSFMFFIVLISLVIFYPMLDFLISNLPPNGPILPTWFRGLRIFSSKLLSELCCW